VCAALVREGVVDKAPISKKDLAAVQAAFNRWHQETGRPYAHLSRILAMSVG
jgi:3-methyladenine DNA glycosylase Tag